MPFPALPNDHALAMLLMTVVALFLFTRERIPLQSSSLFVLVSLVTPPPKAEFLDRFFGSDEVGEGLGG